MKQKYCVDCDKKIDRKSTRCCTCANRITNAKVRGENNPSWQGDDITYHALHTWMNRTHGKANKCENDLNHKGFYEWANLSGKYHRDRSDWKMLCHSCNQRMDWIRRNGDKCKRGHEFTEENTYWNKERRRCRACIAAYRIEYRNKKA